MNFKKLIKCLEESGVQPYDVYYGLDNYSNIDYISELEYDTPEDDGYLIFTYRNIKFRILGMYTSFNGWEFEDWSTAEEVEEKTIEKVIYVPRNKDWKDILEEYTFLEIDPREVLNSTHEYDVVLFVEETDDWYVFEIPELDVLIGISTNL